MVKMQPFQTLTQRCHMAMSSQPDDCHSPAGNPAKDLQHTGILPPALVAVKAVQLRQGEGPSKMRMMANLQLRPRFRSEQRLSDVAEDLLTGKPNFLMANGRPILMKTAAPFQT